MTNRVAAEPVTPRAGYAALARSDLDSGTSLRREFYLDEDLFVAEIDRIFGTSWHYAGHVSEFPEVGSYRTLDLGPEQLVVTRGEDGRFHALFNVCRHRGARVVDAGCGVARMLVCPYHSWTYRLDGSLRKAPHMPADFDSAPHSLGRAWVAVWHGMVFVNAADSEPALLPRLMAAAEEQLARYGLAECRVAASVSYDVAANWKLVWENSQECYHCSANHPEFVKTFDLRQFYRDRDWLDRQISFSADHRFAQTRFELKPGAVSLTLSGQPACRLPLGAGTQTETFAVHLKPTFAVITCPDYVAVMALLPAAPDRTRVEMHWYVHADAVAGEHYELEDVIRVWDATNHQDWHLCERTQLGVGSRHYRPGPLAPEEDSVRAFYHSYASLLDEAGL